MRSLRAKFRDYWTSVGSIGLHRFDIGPGAWQTSFSEFVLLHRQWILLHLHDRDRHDCENNCRTGCPDPWLHCFHYSRGYAKLRNVISCFPTPTAGFQLTESTRHLLPPRFPARTPPIKQSAIGMQAIPCDSVTSDAYVCPCPVRSKPNR